MFVVHGYAILAVTLGFIYTAASLDVSESPSHLFYFILFFWFRAGPKFTKRCSYVEDNLNPFLL